MSLCSQDQSIKFHILSMTAKALYVGLQYIFLAIHSSASLHPMEVLFYKRHKLWD